MLAPMIIGTESVNVSEPDATAATIIAVLVELLCMRAVISRPMNNPMNGLEVATRIDSAAPFPNALNDSPIKLTASINAASASKMLKVIFMVLVVFNAIFQFANILFNATLICDMI